MLSIVAGGSLLLLLLSNLYHLFALNLGDADFLLLPNLHQDLLTGGVVHWFYWCLPPARYIFPDLLVFSLIWPIFNDGLATLFAQVCLYAMLLWLLLACLATRLSGLSFKKNALFILLALALFTLPGLYSDYIVTAIFFPSWHGGTILISLLAWLSWLEWSDKPTGRSLALLLFSSLAAGFCEPLCFMFFIVPAALATLFAKPGWPIKISTSCVVVIMGLLGSWLADRIVPASISQFNHQRVIFDKAFFECLLSFWTSFANIRGLLWWIPLFVVFPIAVLRFKIKRDNIAIWIGLFLVLLMPVAAALLTSRYTNLSNTRYFPLDFFLPFVALFWLLCQSTQRLIIPLGLITAAALLYLITPFQTKWQDITHPADAKLFDHLRESHPGLKCGLGYYQRSINFRYFSKDHVFLADMDEDGYLMTKLTSLAWLGLPYTPPPARQYNYIITQDVPISQIIYIYGTPDAFCRIYFEKRATQVLFYNRNLSGVIARDPQLLWLLSGRMRKSGFLLMPRELLILKSKLLETARH